MKATAHRPPREIHEPSCDGLAITYAMRHSTQSPRFYVAMVSMPTIAICCCVMYMYPCC